MAKFARSVKEIRFIGDTIFQSAEIVELAAKAILEHTEEKFIAAFEKTPAEVLLTQVRLLKNCANDLNPK